MLCELLEIQNGHRWRRQDSFFRYGPIVVSFGPSKNGPLCA